MERVLFIDNRYDNIKKYKNISEYHRIYYGNEFCDVYLPSLKQICTLTNNIKLPITLVFPILTENAFENAVEIIEYVFKYNLHIDEIVFNDWGLYYYLNLNNYPFRLIAGRLIIKNKRDPRISDFDYNILLTNQGIEALNKPLQKHYLNYYKMLNINRIEVDFFSVNSIYQIDDFHITLWNDCNIISVGRICPYANHWKSHRVIDSCNRECMIKHYKYRLKNKNTQVVLTQYGNAIIDQSPCTTNTYDRIVFADFSNDG